jgi:hypothetical protein
MTGIFWNPGVFSYAMIPRCHPNTRILFSSSNLWSMVLTGSNIVQVSRLFENLNLQIQENTSCVKINHRFFDRFRFFLSLSRVIIKI